jgi:hypothetical protein
MSVRFLVGLVMATAFGTGFAQAGEPAPGKKIRCYDVKVQIYQHLNGQKKLLGAPRLRVCEGNSSCISFGGGASVPAVLVGGGREFIPFGLSFTALVTGLDRDRVKLEMSFEKRDVESTTKTGVRLSKHGGEATELAWLGTPVVMVVDADSKENATIVEVVIERAPDMTLPPRQKAQHPIVPVPVCVPDEPMPSSGEDKRP